MVHLRVDEEEVAGGGGGCQQHAANKFQRLRRFLRRKPILLAALACAALLLPYASDYLFVHTDDFDPEDLDYESLLPRILTEGETGESVVEGDDGPTFVFIMGIEGTGHHFIESLLARSPNMLHMEELGLCKVGRVERWKQRGRRQRRMYTSDSGKSGELFHLSFLFFDHIFRSQALFNPMKKYRTYLDAKRKYEAGVLLLKSAHQKAQMSKSTNGEPFHVAINANNCGVPSMISYPNYMGEDRALQNFNLDIFYNMCTDAGVKCKHTYIYRDPYDVIKSTGKNRDFNDNTYDSIRLYTSVMQLIHSQMVSYPEKNLGCFGFLDAKGSQLEQDWERFGKLFGWDSKESFMATAKQINTKSITPMTEEMKAELVPARLGPMMRAFENIYNRVNDFCYSSLAAMENQAVVPEDVSVEAEPPEQVA